MKVYIDFDAAYLVAPRAKSRITGYFHFSDQFKNNTNPDPTLNAPARIECQVLKYMVSSAVEEETSVIFLSMKLAIWIKIMLTDLGHPQHMIPLKTDNSIATSFSNSTLKEETRKAW